jgi:prepilin-type N-terminal cleavage/methylation domain-containing protein
MVDRSRRGATAGFALVEMLIVVLLIGVLLGVAVPNFTRAREEARQKSCVSNLRMIDTAKAMWALDNRKPVGTSVMLTWLVGTYITGPQFATSPPQPRAVEFRCPSSGMLYGPTVGVVGQAPQCPTVSARTGPYPHVLYP